ncbi:hypothetical protein [Streptomyces hydrogenans]
MTSPALKPPTPSTTVRRFDREQTTVPHDALGPSARAQMEVIRP